jgi:plasmid maintenance system antidote protein VapI
MLNTSETQGLQMKKRYPQQELGQRLSDALDERNISRAELARHLSVSRAAITSMCKTGRIRPAVQ